MTKTKGFDSGQQIFIKHKDANTCVAGLLKSLNVSPQVRVIATDKFVNNPPRLPRCTHLERNTIMFPRIQSKHS